MLLTIQNNQISLKVDTLGAQMMELWSSDGVQYLWQGDPAFWGDRAPNLFPFIGRLTANSYKYLGTVYPMGIHGFASSLEFTPVKQGENHLVLELNSTLVTLAQYPFDFSLKITYMLLEKTVKVTYHVRNLSENTMPFGIGGHPGFRVPLVDGERFEDYELEFSCPCHPDRVGFSPTVYLNGHDERYPLREDRYMDLRHDLFDEDAVILRNMARKVTLRSKLSNRGVRVSYPELPFLGIWHWPKTTAHYVCIEPWSSLPSRQDIVEELSCKSDLIHLAPRKVYETTWSIEVF